MPWEFYKFCHKQVSVCYGCGCKFYIECYPEPPSDLVIVSSMRRSYIDSNHQRVVSPQFPKVYYHFNYSCITVHNQFFAPTIIIIPEDLNLYLSPVHKEVLIASQIRILVLILTFVTRIFKLQTFSVAQLAYTSKMKNAALLL